MTGIVAQIVERELGTMVPEVPASWSYTAHGMKLEVWRPRYHRDRKDGFGFRTVQFRVSAEGGGLACGHFIEWSGSGSLEEFFFEADGLSQSDHDTADIVQRVWGEDLSPFDYGTVVRFERLAIKATSHSSEIWSLIHTVIGKEFARRGSMMVLKAFPLEFERPRAMGNKGFRRRASAMSRYYQRRLDVHIIPGPYGADGWMWRPLRYCPAPPIKRPRAPRRVRWSRLIR